MFMNFMNLFIECQTLMFVIFCYLNLYNFVAEKRRFYTYIYEYAYIGTMAVSIILLLLSLIARITVWCVRMYKRRKMESKVANGVTKFISTISERNETERKLDVDL